LLGSMAEAVLGELLRSRACLAELARVGACACG
jgi:hypothetical protein